MPHIKSSYDHLIGKRIYAYSAGTLDGGLLARHRHHFSCDYNAIRRRRFRQGLAYKMLVERQQLAAGRAVGG